MFLWQMELVLIHETPPFSFRLFYKPLSIINPHHQLEFESFISFFDITYFGMYLNILSFMMLKYRFDLEN